MNVRLQSTRRDTLLAGVSLLLRRGYFDSAMGLIQSQVDAGQVSAATLVVHDRTQELGKSFGKARDANAVFLLASLTKPMTVSALMVLVDRKQVALSDPVQRHIPEFMGNGKERVLVRHLLNHTSGLPDMLPENTALRQRHAPLSDFVAATCKTPLLFQPGTQFRYQSMGILMAGEIVSRIGAQPLPLFLQTHVYQPLEMHKTSLGLGGRPISDTMLCQVDEVNDWDWNSLYWRNLASPWGGAHSSGTDMLKFLEYFAHPDGRVLKPETASSMRQCQTYGLARRWGFGWMLNDGTFGRASSQSTFGHEGSTGTLCWCDPQKDLRFVLLTTKPAEHSNKTLLVPVSNAIADAK